MESVMSDESKAAEPADQLAGSQCNDQLEAGKEAAGRNIDLANEWQGRKIEWAAQFSAGGMFQCHLVFGTLWAVAASTVLLMKRALRRMGARRLNLFRFCHRSNTLRR